MSGSILGFLQDMGNYKERAIGRFPIGSKDGAFLVDTVRVGDGIQPFETAVQHPEYNDGDMVIVEAYSTKKDAEVGHEKWVKIMAADELPAELIDCHNTEISQLFGTAEPCPRRIAVKEKP